MNRHEIIQPKTWQKPRGYSNGMLCAAGSRLLFVAGQVGWDETEKVVSAEFHEQFGQALSNILAVVMAAGGKAEDVMRLTIYVTDRSEYEAQLKLVGEQFRKLFGRHYPACALVEVQGLLEQGAKVEIEATAAIAPKKDAVS